MHSSTKVFLSNVVKDLSKRATAALIRDGEFAAFATVVNGASTMTMTGPVNNDEEKRCFALNVRAASVCEKAFLVGFCTEGWIASPGWTERPSLDPNRREIVAIIVETHEGHASARFLTKRRAGKFLRLKPDKLIFGDGPKIGGGIFDELLVNSVLQDDPLVRARAEAVVKARTKLVPSLLMDLDQFTPARGRPQ